MSTELTTPPKAPSALAVMASKINVDPAKLHSTLKNTVFKGASDDELLALVVVANTYGLNPLLKELYAFPAKGGGIVPVVSIDGWVSMVNNHPEMDGVEFEEHHGDSGKLESITCRIWRKDRNRPVSVTEHLSECKRNTEPWKMEHRMLRHKALMQCARYAFGFSGITDEDEATNTPGLRNVTPAKPLAAEPINPFKKPDPVLVPEEIEVQEPEPEIQVDVDPDPENDAAEREAIINDIKDTCADCEITLATFGGLAKKAMNLQPTMSIRDVDMDTLRTIHNNRLKIASREPLNAEVES